jgi:nitrate/TMAO reductase-like tetraheme cytochrome c subunit
MVKNLKDGNEMKAAPFYLVLGISAKETDLEWPYNLIKYTLSLMMKTSHSCFKENSKADLAMNYSKNCVTCHAINKMEETWVPIKLRV